MKISAYLRDLKPYQPGKPIEELVRESGGKPEDIVKVASNENPLGASPRAIEAIVKHLSDLHRYPDASHFEIKRKLSKHFNLAPEQFVIGHGSNDIIEFIIRTFSSPGDNLVMSEAGFAIYDVYGKICGLEVKKAKPRGEKSGPEFSEFQFDLEEMAKLVDEKTRIVFIDNPNNPTGTTLSGDEVEAFLEKVKGYENCVVVLDHAYEEYVDLVDYPDGVDLVKKFPNLLVMRTFSKAYGLAGLRIGYAYGNPELIFYLNQMRPPFNVSSLAVAAGIAALDDVEHLNQTVALNKKVLSFYYSELDEMELSYPKSQGNFVMVDIGSSGSAAYEKLLKLGVIARPLEGYGFMNHLRINTEKEDSSRRVMQALRKVLRKEGN